MSKRIEKYLDRQIRTLQSQPLLLLLVAIFFMGGMMNQVKKSMRAGLSRHSSRLLTISVSRRLPCDFL